jgi:hypothetical protein
MVPMRGLSGSCDGGIVKPLMNLASTGSGLELYISEIDIIFGLSTTKPMMEEAKPHAINEAVCGYRQPFIQLRN